MLRWVEVFCSSWASHFWFSTSSKTARGRRSLGKVTNHWKTAGGDEDWKPTQIEEKIPFERNKLTQTILIVLLLLIRYLNTWLVGFYNMCKVSLNTEWDAVCDLSYQYHMKFWLFMYMISPQQKHMHHGWVHQLDAWCNSALEDWVACLHGTLPETKSSPLTIGHPKKETIVSNHPFSGAIR